MQPILVTAFEPFGGEKLNPTELILKRLPDTVSSYTVKKLLLPVEFARAPELTLAEYDRLTPAAVLMLGQAGGRSAVTPEIRARNIMNASLPDNAGYIMGMLYGVFCLVCLAFFIYADVTAMKKRFAIKGAIDKIGG